MWIEWTSGLVQPKNIWIDSQTEVEETLSPVEHSSPWLGRAICESVCNLFLESHTHFLISLEAYCAPWVAWIAQQKIIGHTKKNAKMVVHKARKRWSFALLEFMVNSWMWQPNKDRWRRYHLLLPFWIKSLTSISYEMPWRLPCRLRHMLYSGIAREWAQWGAGSVAFAAVAEQVAGHSFGKSWWVEMAIWYM